jgi:hypothetical protein
MRAFFASDVKHHYLSSRGRGAVEREANDSPRGCWMPAFKIVLAAVKIRAAL